MDADDNIRVQPNPAKGAVYIYSKNTNLPEISIFAITGEQVFHSDMIASGDQIDIRNYAPGMYLLKIKTEKGLLSRKLLIHRH